MTMPELHPDELLSREANHRLSAAEHADLEAHLGRCPACALERAVRADAVRLRAPTDADHAVAARIVGNVERLLAARRAARPAAATVTGVAATARGSRLVRAAVILLLMTGSGAVAGAVVVRMREAREQSAAKASAVVTTPTVVSPRPRRLPAAPAVPVEPEAIAPVAPEAPAVLAPTAAAPAKEPVRTAAPAPVVPPALPGPAASVDVADGAIIFRRAEQALASGRFAEADQLYTELGRRFAGSRQDVVARVLRGQLRLDHLEDAAGALASFDSYLAAESSGTLAEEARLGRAQALGRLGRREDERAAWLELLRKHPSSVHAATARARLGTLSAP